MRSEDSSWAGWTLAGPTGRAVKEQGVGTYDDDGLFADDERLAAARLVWPERASEDFDKIGKREYLDANGNRYVQVNGSPLYAASRDEGAVDAWFVLNGKLVFLRRADSNYGTTTQRLGSVSGGNG